MSTLLAYAAPPTAIMHNKGAQAYLQTQVQSRTPVELVVLLYDGAIKFLGQAREAMQQRDLAAKRHAMSRATAIIQELQHMLNMEAGGEVAERLDALYTYILGRCYDANMHLEPSGLDESIKLLTPLRDAWSAISGESAPPAA